MLEIYQKVTHGLRPIVPSDALVHLERVDKHLSNFALVNVYQKRSTELFSV
jgi:hypothetical protein